MVTTPVYLQVTKDLSVYYFRRLKGSRDLYTTPPPGTQHPTLTQVDAIGIQNIGSSTVPFCLDKIALVGSPTNGRKMKL